MEKGARLSFVNELSELEISVSPNASFQRQNASLALALANEYVQSVDGNGHTSEDTARCLESTQLPAKFETIPEGGRKWILSSAHNNMSVEAACNLFGLFSKE